MSNKWPTVKVGDVLSLNTNRVSVDPSVTYPMVGVLSYGRGLFDREPIVNGNTSYKFFHRLDSDHFVMSQLFGWEGALALSSGNYAGKYLSPQFPTFRCNSAKLDRKFLGWVTRRPDFWDQLGKKASGMGDRRRTLTPDALLTSEIPLPPLSEQHRIVDLIEAIAGKVEEARRLSEEAEEETARIFFAACETMLKTTEGSYPTEELGNLVSRERGISYGVVQTGVDTPDGIPTLRAGDIQWFECRTIGIKRIAPEVERGYMRTRLRGGELLLRIRGGVGAVAVCPAAMIGGNVSREIAVMPVTDRLDPRFAMYCLAAPTNQDRMTGHVKGTSYVGINLKDVRTLKVPLPLSSAQRRIVAELDELNGTLTELKGVRLRTSAEIDALLPSVLDRAFRGEM